MTLALSAIEAAARLVGRPGRVLLHSGRDDDGCGRYSYVGCDPVASIEARGHHVTVRRDDGTVLRDEFAEPLDVLEQIRQGGMAIGYLGYDLSRTLERLPSVARADMSAPDMWFGLYRALWRRDEHTGECELLGADVPRRDALAARLRRPSAKTPVPVLSSLCADMSRETYTAAVQKLLAYIKAGDVYQVNLARRLRVRVHSDGDALHIYRAIAQQSPCAYGAVLEAPAVRVVSGSPELFLCTKSLRRIETRPIKGTRRRTGDHALDHAAAADLATDAKERAEHLMIVDLERNDLGRIARIGSVRVDSLGRIVELPTLYHMISTVSADVRSEVTTADILRATFPGGSITGAPKVRAMQIIDELEPCRRGVYTGAFGMIGPYGALNLALAIRTAVLCDDSLSLHVGGAVVADSTAAREYAETEEKAAAWRKALATLQ